MHSTKSVSYTHLDVYKRQLLHNGVAPAGPPGPRSSEPLFLALGRLAEYKRIDLLLRLWDRVRPVVGGRLVIAGDGPQRSYLESLAGPGVIFTGRVSEEEKNRLLRAAWLLVHPALIEGWGIVVTEAALRLSLIHIFRAQCQRRPRRAQVQRQRGEVGEVAHRAGN